MNVEPAFKTNNIAIVCAADNNYAVYLGVMLQSLIDHTTPQNNYDIVVLQTSITPSNQHRIRSLTSAAKNISIRFWDVSSLANQHIFFIDKYFSIETYYRLFIPQLFRAYEKILYLDVDLLICKDVAELYQLKLGDNLVAATWNISTVVHINNDKLVVNGVTWKDYLKNTLRMGDGDVLAYLQAGVMLFNIKQMLIEDTQSKLLSKAVADNHVMHDQDTLNSICYGRIKYFSQAWNLHNNFNKEKGNLSSLDPLPANIREDYLIARHQPFIIHYAGPIKPWMSPIPEFHNLWWLCARQTIFYEEIIHRNLSPHGFSMKFKCWRYYFKYKLSFGEARKEHKQQHRKLHIKLKNARALARQCS